MNPLPRQSRSPGNGMPNAAAAPDAGGPPLVSRVNRGCGMNITTPGPTIINSWPHGWRAVEHGFFLGVGASTGVLFVYGAVINSARLMNWLAS